MSLVNNIVAINGGAIFQHYAMDALLLDGRVLKNGEDVGLTDRNVNYFYTRYDEKPLKIQAVQQKLSSCVNYEVVSPKVLVVQFKEYDFEGIMFAILNVFNDNYNSTRYEVSQVEIRKDLILKQEIGEVKPFNEYAILKFYYNEIEPINNCKEIKCKEINC